jgi:hypothetical protein
LGDHFVAPATVVYFAFPLQPQMSNEIPSPKFSRRRQIALLLTGMGASGEWLPMFPRANAASNRAADRDGVKTVKVKSVLEVKGKVHLNDLRSNKAGDKKSSPIESRSELEYEESFQHDATSGERRSIQQYQLAQVENQIDKHSTKLVLRDACREIASRSNERGSVTACFQHPLTAGERDLVEGPIDTACIDEFVPSKRHEIGGKWSLSGDSVKRLFRMDSLQSGEIHITLIDSTEDSEEGELSGELKGEIDDVATTIRVRGKVRIDRKSGLVGWLALLIEEDREVGESRPGFSLHARLRILRESIDGLSSGDTLENLSSAIGELDIEAQLIQFESKPGAYKFIVDRSWTTILDSGIDSTLRFVKSNRTLAYCTITNLADREPGKQLTLEGFQHDIKKTLGNQFAQFLEAGEKVSPLGLRMMRIVTAGTTEGVPVQWINILLSNDAGRHLSLAFTMSQSNVDAFGTQDMQMAGSMEFSLRQLPTAPETPKDDSIPVETAKSAGKDSILKK